MLKTSSSLAFRSLLKTAAFRAGLDRAAPELSGLSRPAVAFHAAALAQDEPVFLVVPTDADVEQVSHDARFFFASLSGVTDTAARDAVRAFPSQEVDPYRGLLPHLEIASVRAGTLYAMTQGTARLVVASARALAPRLSAPTGLSGTGQVIVPGTEIAPRALGEHLALAGFAPEDPVDEHGEFCVRGGIVDLYPAGETQPFRLEFIGDIVESVRRYDAATQRSLAAVDQVAVPPQRELLPDPARPDDPQAFDRSATVLDYVRRMGASLVVCEIEDVGARGVEQERQWERSAADMEARGRAGLPFDDLAWRWEDVEVWLGTGRRVTELAIGEPAPGARHVACLPSARYHGRVGDWVDEIRRARERGDTVVFVAAHVGTCRADD